MDELDIKGLLKVILDREGYRLTTTRDGKTVLGQKLLEKLISYLPDLAPSENDSTFPRRVAHRALERRFNLSDRHGTFDGTTWFLERELVPEFITRSIETEIALFEQEQLEFRIDVAAREIAEQCIPGDKPVEYTTDSDDPPGTLSFKRRKNITYKRNQIRSKINTTIKKDSRGAGAALQHTLHEYHARNSLDYVAASASAALASRLRQRPRAVSAPPERPVTLRIPLSDPIDRVAARRILRTDWNLRKIQDLINIQQRTPGNPYEKAALRRFGEIERKRPDTTKKPRPSTTTLKFQTGIYSSTGFEEKKFTTKQANISMMQGTADSGSDESPRKPRRVEELSGSSRPHTPIRNESLSPPASPIRSKRRDHGNATNRSSTPSQRPSALEAKKIDRELKKDGGSPKSSVTPMQPAAKFSRDSKASTDTEKGDSDIGSEGGRPLPSVEKFRRAPHIPIPKMPKSDRNDLVIWVKPQIWAEKDGDGPDVESKLGRQDLTAYNDWKLYTVPMDSEMTVDKGTWPPKNVKLDNYNLVRVVEGLVAGSLSKKEARACWPYDFVKDCGIEPLRFPWGDMQQQGGKVTRLFGGYDCVGGADARRAHNVELWHVATGDSATANKSIWITNVKSVDIVTAEVDAYKAKRKREKRKAKGETGVDGESKRSKASHDSDPKPRLYSLERRGITDSDSFSEEDDCEGKLASLQRYRRERKKLKEEVEMKDIEIAQLKSILGKVVDGYFDQTHMTSVRSRQILDFLRKRGLGEINEKMDRFLKGPLHPADPSKVQKAISQTEKAMEKLVELQLQELYAKCNATLNLPFEEIPFEVGLEWGISEDPISYELPPTESYERSRKE